MPADRLPARSNVRTGRHGRRQGTRATRVGFVLALMAGALGLATAAPASGNGGEPFNGTFTADAVRPPECTSPVGFCTHGILIDERGRAVATYDFTMLTSEPTGNGTEFRFTGRSLITKLVAPHGTMTGEDEGVIEFRATEGSPFTTRVHVVGGTGAYEVAGGLITAEGELELATGATAGTYTGTIERGR